MHLFDLYPSIRLSPLVVWRVRESISEPLMTGAGRQANCLAGSARPTSVRVNLAKRLARVCLLSRYRITSKCDAGTHARKHTHTHPCLISFVQFHWQHCSQSLATCGVGYCDTGERQMGRDAKRRGKDGKTHGKLRRPRRQTLFCDPRAWGSLADKT